ncbi:MAG: intermembrane phospholipid transport protein YdbH family protein [Thermodesulfobacteriota bacterium]
MTARTRHLLLTAGLLLAAVPLLLWAGLTIVAPAFLTGRLLPELAAEHGLTTLQVRPVLVGPGRLQSEIVIGLTDNPVLHIASVAVDYSAGNLLRGRIDRLTLSGVEMRCRFSDGNLLIGDAGFNKLLKGQQVQKATAGPTGLPAFFPRQISIRQAAIICRTDRGVIRLPFAAEIDLTAPEQPAFQLTLDPDNEPILLAGHYGTAPDALEINLTGANLHPHRFAAFVPLLAKINTSTALTITAAVRIGLQPFILREMTGTVTLHPGPAFVAAGADEAPLTVALSANQQASGLPLRIALDSEPVAVLLHAGATPYSLHIGGMRLETSLAIASPQPATNTPRLQGEISLNDGSLARADKSIAITNLQFRLPFSWPFAIGTEAGQTGFDLRRENTLVGRFKGQVRQLEHGIAMTGAVATDLLPGATAATSLTGDFADTVSRIDLQIDLPALQLRDFSPAALVTSAPEANVSGTLAGHAVARITDGNLTGNATLSLSEGKIILPDRKLTMSGIACTLTFPELPTIRSAPGQRLTFTDGEMGKLRWDGGNVTFTIESPRSLLLETADLHWAGGTLSAHALRFAGATSPPEVVLYGNRLRLATILGLAGIDNVEGNGTVNGRIPILFSNGTIRFAPSFLYSTPGEGGVIRIAGGDFLTQVMPAATVQYSQLDFTREALRHFSYNWAKLHLVSENDALLMQLKLDGKPAAPLPFAYDSANGSFRRLPADEATSVGISHPLLLDVNFRFPLNTFLEYDKSIQEFLRRTTGQ